MEQVGEGRWGCGGVASSRKGKRRPEFLISVLSAAYRGSSEKLELIVWNEGRQRMARNGEPEIKLASGKRQMQASGHLEHCGRF